MFPSLGLWFVLESRLRNSELNRQQQQCCCLQSKRQTTNVMFAGMVGACQEHFDYNDGRNSHSYLLLPPRRNRPQQGHFIKKAHNTPHRQLREQKVPEYHHTRHKPGGTHHGQLYLSSQFLDQVPSGHAAHGVPSSSNVDRYVPGGHMSATEVRSSAQVVPGGQG